MNRRINGLKIILFGSFLTGSGVTLLFTDIWLRNNKKYKFIKVKD